MIKRRRNELVGHQLDTIETTLTSSVLTFDDALKLFIADANRKGLREFTIKYYRRELNDFRNFLQNEGHSLKVDEVVRANVENFVEELQNKRMSKNGTVNAKLRAIRAFFNYLFDSKHIEGNPMYKFPLMKDRKGNVETFTLSQLKALLNAPDRRTFTGQRDYTFMLLLLETGIRLNEAAGILVEDVKLSEGTVFLRNTKNHFHRYVPIQAKMQEQLRRYLKLRGSSETDYLFISLDEQPLTRSSLQKLVGKYGKQAGIKGVRCSPHTLRHTFAKMSVINGAGVFELQKILGHSTMDMVRTYVNLFSSEVSEKHKKFSPLNNLDQ